MPEKLFFEGFSFFFNRLKYCESISVKIKAFEKTFFYQNAENQKSSINAENFINIDDHFGTHGWDLVEIAYCMLRPIEAKLKYK